MHKSILLILYTLFSLSVLSQNVVVTGIAEGQTDKLIRIIVYSDQFSNLEHTIASTKTNRLGEFTMKFRVDKTQFAFIAFGLEKGEFYLSPDANYHFDIIVDTASNKGSIFDKLPLNFTLKADDGGIQQSIGDFNEMYNDFIYNNIIGIYKSRDKSIVMQFVSDVRTKYANEKSKYVSNYVEYSLASLLWLSRKESNLKVLEKYIINKPVLYHNIQYTDFFKDFFKSYFDREKSYTYSELIFAINNRDSVDVLSNLLSKNEQLKPDNKVCEIVEILLLSRNYHNSDVIKKRVISKLNFIAHSSKYTDNKLIAKNFIIELQALQYGSHAPDFKYVDEGNDTVTLDSYNGKFLLLNFIKEDCEICKYQMQFIMDLRTQFGNKFEILTIFDGDNIDDIVYFIKERGWDWPILKAGNKILVFEDYNIVVYPSYIFINPDGTIANAQLPMPDENMELQIRRLMERYGNKQ